MTLTENWTEKKITSAYYFLHRRQMDKVTELLGQVMHDPKSSVIDLAQAKTIWSLYMLVQERYSGNSDLLAVAQLYQNEAKELLDNSPTDAPHYELALQRWNTINGYVLLERNLIDEAEVFFESVIKAEEKWSRVKLFSLIGLSRVAERREQLNEAVEIAQRILDMWRVNPELEHEDIRIEVLAVLSQIFIKKQDFEQSLRYSNPLLVLARKTGNVEMEIVALCNVGVANAVLSDYKTAMQYTLEAQEKSRALGYRFYEAQSLMNIGTIHAQLYSNQEALDRYKTLLSDYKDVMTKHTNIALNNNMGHLYFLIGNLDLSFVHFEQALSLAREARSRETIAYVLAQISRNSLVRKDFERALKTSEEADFLFQQIGRRANGRQINALNLAEITFWRGDTEGGVRLAKWGTAIAQRVHDRASELRGYRILANALGKYRQFEKAYRAQTIVNNLQEDIARTQRDKQMLDLEIKHSLLEKQRKIEQLTNENEFQAELLKQQSQIEEQNEQLQRVNAELQQFAYITSHDLKEPLRMIGSFTQIVQRKTKPFLKPEDESFFTYINEGVNRMSNLLDALLQYATVGKFADVDREEISINAIVRIARTNLKLKIEESNAEITSDAMPILMSVQTILVQLFQNLISNAIKFRKPNINPIIHIGAQEREKDWIFYVKDNGIGIAEEHLQRVFVIFQRLHTRQQYEGTGIGLAICQKIVQQLGGKIWVESVYGEGSTFFFTLPKYEKSDL